MNRDALLPCPFCGGEAQIINIGEGENAGGSCVECAACHASSNVEFEFKENFVSNWNTRALPVGVEEAGFLPIGLCPTDGVPRTLRLPDGSEVVGYFNGRWMAVTTIEYAGLSNGMAKGGFAEAGKAPAITHDQVETPRSMTRAGAMPDGVYPTRFRPNDTVYGLAALSPRSADGEKT